MGKTLTEKILKNHLVSGKYGTDDEIGIKIDQTLTQDSTGTMAYLQLEAMNIDRVKTKLSVAYIDHNMLQSGPENADDHLYIQTVAKKYGIYFSRPGNGICHQVHLERFGVPGDTLLGSDSHTPTCGGLGMIAIGAGGLDVAVAMAGGAYFIKTPKVVKVNLKGKLRGYASAKDIILEVLRECTVAGGINKIFEYAGEGVKCLSVPERGTITNMGAELGATTSIFPSDENTLAFLRAQGREKDYKPLSADKDAVYDEVIDIDLDKLKPLVACPHSPDAVVPARKLKDVRLTQVAIGSCTNSSYVDLMKVANILDGGTVDKGLSLVVSPGSKQVLTMLSENGALTKMINAGARILESGCGPCIGMGQAPSTGGVSLRTFNRNFKGRCGTETADVYLASPEIAAMSAIKGYIASEEDFDEDIDLNVEFPDTFLINDNLIIEPVEKNGDVEIIRGPNIKPFPKNKPLGDLITGKALIKVGDGITTDHIMPSNAQLLPYRSNIPYLSEFCFSQVDRDFATNAKKYGGGIIVGGLNYGQGSSREHAALAPLYLGIKAVIAKSFARIHKNNLINNGIIPLTFKDNDDYLTIDAFDELEIQGVLSGIDSGEMIVLNKTKNLEYITNLEVTERHADMLKSGGLLNIVSQSDS